MNTFRGGRVEGKLIKGFEIEMEVDTYWPQFEISIRLRKYVHVPSFHRFFHAVSFFFSPLHSSVPFSIVSIRAR